jgi:hypothetical protein
LDRENEILLHEPERLNPQTVLSAEAQAHRTLHLSLEQMAGEWNKKSPLPSAGFNERLLQAIEQSSQIETPVNESHFAPIAGPGEGLFLRNRGLLSASAALLVFASGAFLWLQNQRHAEIPGQKTANPAESLPREETTERAEKDVALPSTLPAPVAKRQMDNQGLSAPASAPAREESVRQRGDWDEEGAVDPETELLARIASETDPLKREQLQQRLLQLYQGTGQTEKAELLRRQMR